MTLYLVDRRFDFEPVGVWNDEMDSAYVDPESNEAKLGRFTVTDKGAQVPWSVFVENKTRSVNHRTWWTPFESPLGLAAALAELRENFFTSEATRVTQDN
jgi:hypothetical protein